MYMSAPITYDDRGECSIRLCPPFVSSCILAEEFVPTWFDLGLLLVTLIQYLNSITA